MEDSWTTKIKMIRALTTSIDIGRKLVMKDVTQIKNWA